MLNKGLVPRWDGLQREYPLPLMENGITRNCGLKTWVTTVLRHVATSSQHMFPQECQEAARKGGAGRLPTQETLATLCLPVMLCTEGSATRLLP